MPFPRLLGSLFHFVQWCKHTTASLSTHLFYIRSAQILPAVGSAAINVSVYISFRLINAQQVGVELLGHKADLVLIFWAIFVLFSVEAETIYNSPIVYKGPFLHTLTSLCCFVFEENAIRSLWTLWYLFFSSFQWVRLPPSGQSLKWREFLFVFLCGGWGQFKVNGMICQKVSKNIS